MERARSAPTWALRLTAAAPTSHLIARGAHLEAIQRDGVRVLSPRGDFEAHPPATSDPAEIGAVDIVFLGLKAYSYAGAPGICSSR